MGMSEPRPSHVQWVGKRTPVPEWGDDSSLLAAIARGERAAAEALVDRTYARVFALLLHLTGNRDVAADLTQDTYRKAWGALATFDGRAQLSTWLHRIAYTTFLNHVRRPRLVVTLDEEVAAAVPDGRTGAEEELEAVERSERVRQAVLDLPEELRCVVVARYWGDAPVAEVAALEGVSEVAIRKRLKRAVERLSQALGEVR